MSSDLSDTNLSRQILPNPCTDTSLSNHTPLETKTALVIVNVQNNSFFVWNNNYIIKNHDFVLPLKEMINYFRSTNLDIIWTCYHVDPKRYMFYQEGTQGAEIKDELRDLVDREKDLIVTTSDRIAFKQTSLIMALRENLITDIYLCGCLTKVAVFSTAVVLVSSGY